MAKPAKFSVSEDEYHEWGKYWCPCHNPWCNPSENAICIRRKLNKKDHKDMIRKDTGVYSK